MMDDRWWMNIGYCWLFSSGLGFGPIKKAPWVLHSKGFKDPQVGRICWQSYWSLPRGLYMCIWKYIIINMHITGLLYKRYVCTVLLDLKWPRYAKMNILASNWSSHFHPYLGKIPNFTHIFQVGWFNHQLVILFIFFHRLPSSVYGALLHQLHLSIDGHRPSNPWTHGRQSSWWRCLFPPPEDKPKNLKNCENPWVYQESFEQKAFWGDQTKW